jgi:ribonucleoside-diphosphate reductase alpha chain
MIATNPCGEQPLLGNESCNLGSLNLANFFYNREQSADWKNNINWDKMAKVIRTSVRFLDNVIDANQYATPDIEKMTKATRKIGLGIMGFADLLIQLRVGYDTKKGQEIGRHIMGFIRDVADNESTKLAEERGTFPAWDNSDYAVCPPMVAACDHSTHKKYRNACRLTVAPTGTISMLADTSSGVEPTFALAWKKMNILEGQTLYYVNKYFEKDAKAYGFYSDALMEHISNGGSIKDRDDVPQWAKEVYVTAMDISPEAHVAMQSAFQESCDSGISKTINFANDASIEDVYTAYMNAWESGCKGITVYRSGSREKEVLVKADTEKDKQLASQTLEDYISQLEEEAIIATVAVPTGGAEDICCSDPFLADEGGCVSCKNCGWSKCHIA